MENNQLNMDNLLKHLITKSIISNDAKIDKLNKGGSGADLFEINCSSGNYILKSYDTETILKLGEKEYKFYCISNNFNLKYLPEVIYSEKHDTLGIIILLKKYRDIAIAEWDLEHQQTAADIIAQVHSRSKFFINQLNIKDEPFIPPADKEMEKAYSDWNNVLESHNLNRTVFENINKNFERIILFEKEHRNYFLHGDFFPNNCVLDENGNMILIDWQNCKLGSKAEIAFFISISYDWGISVHENAIKKHYCERLSHYTGRTVSMRELDETCNMSTVFTTYVHWANYLQESGIDRVKPIFDKMIVAYEWLLNNNCL